MTFRQINNAKNAVVIKRPNRPQLNSAKFTTPITYYMVQQKRYFFQLGVHWGRQEMIIRFCQLTFCPHIQKQWVTTDDYVLPDPPC